VCDLSTIAREGARVGALVAATLMLLGSEQAAAVPPDRAAALESYLVLSEQARALPGWTGSVAGCVAGTESQASIDATLHTVNALRDFAGVAPVTFDSELNRRALAAALMMRAAGDLNHYRPRAGPATAATGPTRPTTPTSPAISR